MKRHRLALASALATGATLAAAAVAHAAAVTTDYMGRPTDVSKDGHLSDTLFDITTLFVSLLFIIMVGIIVTTLLKHREGHSAHYEHGIGRSHLILTAIVSSLIFFIVDGNLLAESFYSIHTAYWNFPTAEQKPLVLEVMAQQWVWNIRYPGPDGKFNTEDDVVTLNEMHVPVNRPVMIKLRSKDVIHSFYLPNFRIKQDAMPGTTTKMWFEAKEAGTYDIGCAQHCGVNHYKMRGDLVVESDKDFDDWYKEAVADGRRRNDLSDKESQWGWDWESGK
jgi:cytochrome c oxidase subunit 2